MTGREIVGRSGTKHQPTDALSTVNNLNSIHRFMREIKPERTLEIGMSYGGSALAFCAAHKDLGHPAQAQHIAIDPYETSPTAWDSCGLMAIERAGLSGYLDFRQAYSALELPKLVESGHRFGLIYVDGSHLFEDVFVDLYYVMRLLTEGGVMLLDDSFNRHVKKVLRFLRRSGPPGIKEIDLGVYRNDRLKYAIAKRLGQINLTAFRRVGDVERRHDAAYRSF